MSDLKQIICLLEGQEEYLSGEKISAELGISRAAVWKKIELLRQKGFDIKAAPSRGYKLFGSPDLSADEILARTEGGFWKAVSFYESAGSTNDIALALAVGGQFKSGTVIVADTQRKGRGRLGRAWVSPPGKNVYMSAVFRPELRPRDATFITIISALACADALREVGVGVSIKWPNDLMASSRKIGGILTEVRSDPEEIHAAVVGIGINVNIRKAEFPPEIRNIATSVLEETGEALPRGKIIISILKELERWFGIFAREGRRMVLDAWRLRSSTLGRQVRVTAAGAVLEGLAEDIDDEGMLILRLNSGERRRVSAGDVAELR